MQILLMTLLFYPDSAAENWDEIRELENHYHYHFPLASGGNQFSEQAILESKEKLLDMLPDLQEPSKRAHCHYLIGLIEWNICNNAKAARYYAGIAINLNGHQRAVVLRNRLPNEQRDDSRDIQRMNENLKPHILRPSHDILISIK